MKVTWVPMILGLEVDVVLASQFFLMILLLHRHSSHPPVIPGEARCLEALYQRSLKKCFGGLNTSSKGVTG